MINRRELMQLTGAALLAVTVPAVATPKARSINERLRSGERIVGEMIVTDETLEICEGAYMTHCVIYSSAKGYSVYADSWSNRTFMFNTVICADKLPLGKIDVRY